MQTNKKTIVFDKESLTILFTNNINYISQMSTVIKRSTSAQCDWFKANIDSTARELENLLSIVCNSVVEYKPTSIVYCVIFGTDNDLNMLADNIEKYYIEKLSEKYAELPNTKSSETYSQIKTIILRISR